MNAARNNTNQPIPATNPNSPTTVRPGARAAEWVRPRSLHIVAATTSPAVTTIVAAACTQDSRKSDRRSEITTNMAVPQANTAVNAPAARRDTHGERRL
jgi:hypothetical protein